MRIITKAKLINDKFTFKEMGYFVCFYYDNESDQLIPYDPLGYILTPEDINFLLKGVKKFYKNIRNNPPVGNCEQDYFDWRNQSHKEFLDRKPLKTSLSENMRSALVKPGYVYFVEGDGKTKIGKASHLNNRLKFFDLKLPFKITLIHTIKSNHYTECEKYFHEYFSSKRVNGEWFDLNDKDLEWIKSINEKNF